MQDKKPDDAAKKKEPDDAAKKKEPDEAAKKKEQERQANNLRTIYLQENRLVGFQLAGDITSAGVLHALMTQKADISHLEKHLLDPNFGEGMLAWSAIQAYQ